MTGSCSPSRTQKRIDAPALWFGIERLARDREAASVNHDMFTSHLLELISVDLRKARG